MVWSGIAKPTDLPTNREFCLNFRVGVERVGRSASQLASLLEPSNLIIMETTREIIALLVMVHWLASLLASWLAVGLAVLLLSLTS